MFRIFLGLFCVLSIGACTKPQQIKRPNAPRHSRSDGLYLSPEGESTLVVRFNRGWLDTPISQVEEMVQKQFKDAEMRLLPKYTVVMFRGNLERAYENADRLLSVASTIPSLTQPKNPLRNILLGPNHSFSAKLVAQAPNEASLRSIDKIHRRLNQKWDKPKSKSLAISSIETIDSIQTRGIVARTFPSLRAANEARCAFEIISGKDAHIGLRHDGPLVYAEGRVEEDDIRQTIRHLKRAAARPCARHRRFTLAEEALSIHSNAIPQIFVRASFDSKSEEPAWLKQLGDMLEPTKMARTNMIKTQDLKEHHVALLVADFFRNEPANRHGQRWVFANALKESCQARSFFDLKVHAFGPDLFIDYRGQSKQDLLAAIDCLLFEYPVYEARQKAMLHAQEHHDLNHQMNALVARRIEGQAPAIIAPQGDPQTFGRSLDSEMRMIHADLQQAPIQAFVGEKTMKEPLEALFRLLPMPRTSVAIDGTGLPNHFHVDLSWREPQAVLIWRAPFTRLYADAVRNKGYRVSWQGQGFGWQAVAIPALSLADAHSLAKTLSEDDNIPHASDNSALFTYLRQLFGESVVKKPTMQMHDAFILEPKIMHSAPSQP